MTTFKFENIKGLSSSTINKIKNLLKLDKAKQMIKRNPKSARSFLMSLKAFFSSILRFLFKTKSGRVLCAIFFFLGYILLRYYNAYYEIICKKTNSENIKILRHLKPRLKNYNPTYYIFHPMLSIIIGDSRLNSNFVIKFSPQVRTTSNNPNFTTPTKHLKSIIHLN
jgi:hypothetical protein